MVYSQGAHLSFEWLPNDTQSGGFERTPINKSVNERTVLNFGRRGGRIRQRAIIINNAIFNKPPISMQVILASKALMKTRTEDARPNPEFQSEIGIWCL